MQRLKRKTVQIGDLFEILTAKGICCGQVINRHERSGYIIAIFGDFYERRPKDLTELVWKRPHLILEFPIQAALRQGFFPLIANVERHPSLKTFPTFIGINPYRADNPNWFFWNGLEEWWRKGELTEEEKRFPQFGSVPSLSLLIKWIQEGRTDRDALREWKDGVAEGTLGASVQ